MTEKKRTFALIVFHKKLVPVRKPCTVLRRKDNANAGWEGEGEKKGREGEEGEGRRLPALPQFSVRKRKGEGKKESPSIT